MEDFYNVKRLALILAIQAEIEGMKVDNLIWERQGADPSYGYKDFKDKALDLENLAHAHNEQL